jgi:7-keto-8-aminopelargonate synthetase-like enzyme
MHSIAGLVSAAVSKWTTIARSLQIAWVSSRCRMFGFGTTIAGTQRAHLRTQLAHLSLRRRKRQVVAQLMGRLTAAVARKNVML